MSTETYGSFRVEFLHNKEGEILRGNSLFFNIYDLLIHCSGFYLGTYERKVTKLKKISNRKWKGQKKLPGFNILMRKIKDGDEVFNPIEFKNGNKTLKRLISNSIHFYANKLDIKKFI